MGRMGGGGGETRSVQSLIPSSTDFSDRELTSKYLPHPAGSASAKPYPLHKPCYLSESIAGSARRARGRGPRDGSPRRILRASRKKVAGRFRGAGRMAGAGKGRRAGGKGVKGRGGRGGVARRRTAPYMGSSAPGSPDCCRLPLPCNRPRPRRRRRQNARPAAQSPAFGAPPRPAPARPGPPPPPHAQPCLYQAEVYRGCRQAGRRRTLPPGEPCSVFGSWPRRAPTAGTEARPPCRCAREVCRRRRRAAA